MTARAQIRLLVIIQALLTLLGVAAELAGVFEFPRILVIGLSALWLAVLYFLDRGASWARAVALVLSVVGLLDFLALFQPGRGFTKVYALMGGILSVYTWIVLNSRAVKEHFQAGSQEGARRRLPRWLKIALAIGAVVVASVAVFVGFVFWMISQYGGLQVWMEDVETGRTTQRTHSGTNQWPRFSPDGSQIAYVHAEDLKGSGGYELVVESIADRSVVVVQKNNNMIQSPSWEPGGRKIAYVASDGSGDWDLWLFSLENRTTTQLTQDGGGKSIAAWSPDGRWIAYLHDVESQGSQIRVIPAGGGEPRVVSVGTGLTDGVRSFAWARDGSRIGFVRGGPRLTVRNLTDDTERLFELGAVQNPANLVFLPNDTDRLVFSALPAGSMKVAFYVVTLADGEVREWRKDRPLVELHLDISPDGQRMAYARPAKKG